MAETIVSAIAEQVSDAEDEQIHNEKLKVWLGKLKEMPLRS
ncbi:hypothetical protein Pint_11872 [Pistacia integerrima]|uniref:Uncharacterized protein n=1 Tax=Pistacia integerrima TaxID=434235 RepID=A0ACC0XHI2_9ROSI|nr:hypothetical protein Pint_11872 [Pistacia integerrima]